VDRRRPRGGGHVVVLLDELAKAANPNGLGLTSWPVYNPKDEYLMNLETPSRWNGSIRLVSI